MRICYVDEAGCTGMLPRPVSNIQPVFAIAAIIFNYANLHRVTESFLQLKQRFYPNLFPLNRKQFLSGILAEVKGAELRNRVAKGDRNARRHAFGFLDGVFKIMEDNGIQVVGRVWVKGIGMPIDGTALYTFSIQSIYVAFQEYCRSVSDLGMVVLDSRWHGVNKQVAHSIFTQKFRMAGDAYDRIIDLPAFAHSDNHAGLQIADLLASAILFPAASHVYCAGKLTNVHVHPNFSRIGARYKDRLRSRQYRYTEANTRRRGGIIVSDGLGQQSGSLLFR